MRAIGCLVVAFALGCQTPAAPPAAPDATPSETRTEPAPPSDQPQRDYTAIRTQYGDRPDFSELCEQERPLREFFELGNAGKWSDVLAISEPWLVKCPVDIDARLVSGIAFAELGKDDQAREQFTWHEGLVRSILASGDGRSAETPFVVISVPEEYALLRALELQSKGQQLLGGGIDELTVVDKESRTFSVFFSPAAHFRRLDRLFAPKPKP